MGGRTIVRNWGRCGYQNITLWVPNIGTITSLREGFGGKVLCFSSVNQHTTVVACLDRANGLLEEKRMTCYSLQPWLAEETRLESANVDKSHSLKDLRACQYANYLIHLILNLVIKLNFIDISFLVCAFWSKLK